MQLTVRGDPVEPLATHPEPFDRFRANGGCYSISNSIVYLPGFAPLATLSPQGGRGLGRGIYLIR